MITIALTDEQILKMAEYIRVCKDLDKIAPAAPHSLLCCKEEGDTRGISTFTAGFTAYDGITKPIIARYRAECMKLSESALNEIKAEFRKRANGEAT